MNNFDFSLIDHRFTNNSKINRFNTRNVRIFDRESIDPIRIDEYHLANLSYLVSGKARIVFAVPG